MFKSLLPKNETFYGHFDRINSVFMEKRSFFLVIIANLKMK